MSYTNLSGDSLHGDESRRRGTSRSVSSGVTKYFRSCFAGCSSMLDVGCGKGEILWPDSVGIDLDFVALRKAGERVVQVDVTHRLPFSNEVFDGILAKDILEHVTRPRDLLEELHRVAIPGGRLVVVTPRDLPRAVWADYTHVRGFTRGALEALLHDAGWSVQKLHRMGPVPLADRLNLISSIPKILAIPGVGHYLGTNWQAWAAKAP
jgi:SAM-dependent methyltransferase